MRLCIITDDRMIAKYDSGYSGLDISYIPDTVHAFQWYETHGEIEYKTTAPYRKPANEFVTELPDWANTAVAKWEEAKAIEDAAIAEAVRVAAQNQPISQGLQQA